MDIEDTILPPFETLPLNASYLGHEDSYWWKTADDPNLPQSLSFVRDTIVINIATSTKSIPYFFRIGKNQPIPSLQFHFDSHCIGSKYEMYVNLRDQEECRIGIELIDGGFKIAATDGEWRKIKDASKSPILVFGTEKAVIQSVFVKVDSPISIDRYDLGCNISNLSDVPEDQFALQIAHWEGGTCATAEVMLYSGDVVSRKIGILVDHSKIHDTTVPGNGTLAASGATTSSHATASIEWWWYVGGGIL